MFSCFALLFLLLMACINIGSLNVNGCRDRNKRRSLFDFVSLKACSVLFLQETHTDIHNQEEWRREWKGQVFLSHGSNTSAGVGILFSEQLKWQPINVIELVPGRLLRVDVDVDSYNFSFFNIYAPNIGAERREFFLPEFKICHIRLPPREGDFVSWRF